MRRVYLPKNWVHYYHKYRTLSLGWACKLFSISFLVQVPFRSKGILRSTDRFGNRFVAMPHWRSCEVSDGRWEKRLGYSMEMVPSHCGPLESA